MGKGWSKDEAAAPTLCESITGTPACETLTQPNCAAGLFTLSHLDWHDLPIHGCACVCFFFCVSKKLIDSPQLPEGRSQLEDSVGAPLIGHKCGHTCAQVQLLFGVTAKLSFIHNAAPTFNNTAARAWDGFSEDVPKSCKLWFPPTH